ncbi:PAS domain-containing protein [Marinobacteraceae bacterium S3BR75-40.1]
MDASTNQLRLWLKVLPITALAIGSICTVLLWFTLKQAFIGQIEAALPTLHAQQVQTLQEAIEGRQLALRQLADSLPYTPRDRTALQRLGGNLLQSYPDVTALVWAKRESGQLKITQRLGQSPDAVDQVKTLQDIPYWQKALEQAQATGHIQATPVSQIDGTKLFQNVVHLIQPLPGGGVIAMAISPKLLVEESISQGFALPRLYDQSSQSQQPLYSPEPQYEVPAPNKIDWSSTIVVANREWLLQSLPVTTLPMRIQGILQAVLIVGLGLSLIVFLMLFRLLRRWVAAREEIDTLHEDWSRDRSALQNKAIEKQVLAHALEDSEKRTRDYIALQDGFAYELDDAWRIGFLSPQIHELIDKPPAELAQKSLLDLVVEEDRGRVEEALRACLRDREIARIDTRFISHSGEPVAVTLRVKAVMDAINECMGYRGTGWRRTASNGT